MASQESIRLLSLDGGGIRGLSSLVILKHLMEQVNPADPPKPCDYFQLIGGTSTGGLIAIMLGRLHMSIDECIDKYTAMSSAAFTLKRVKIDLVGRGKDKWTTRGKYSSESLADAFKTAAEQVEGDIDAKMLEPNGQCKVFVCANIKSQNQPVLIRSYAANHAVRNLSLAKCRIWEAARATSAAATFFSPMQIGEHEYVDGATGMNNPVEMVLDEAKKIWTDAPRKIQCIVSIGTGVPTNIDFGDNALEISKTLVALSTETEKTEKRFYLNQTDLGVGGRYFRFNVSQGLKEIGLDEYEKTADITAVTEEYLEDPLVREKVVLFTEAEAPQISSVTEATKTAYLTWLPYMDPFVQHNKARDLRKNKQTGEWFLDGHFKQWIQNKGSFTWLHAKAGSGKTVLSSAVIDEIQKLHQGCLLFFYFTFQGEERDSDILLRFKYTLLTQLLRGLVKPDAKKPNYFTVPVAFRELYEKYHPSTQPTTEDVDAVLWKMLSQSTDTYIVIDGLDEYAERHRDHAIPFLADMARHQAHVLVTSRNEPDIERIVSKLSINTTVIPIEIESVNHDIRRHLDDLVKVEPFSEWTKDVRNMVVDHLTQHADGVFRWADLQMQSLAGKTRKKDVSKALAKLPKGLEQTYERMLQRIEDNDEADEAITILKWLFCARRPLNLKQVTELAAFDVGSEDDQFSVTFDSEARYKDDQPIRRTLSGLISFTESADAPNSEVIVSFAHFSVREYLQSGKLCPASFRLNMFDCNWFVFRCCVAYIRHYDMMAASTSRDPFVPYPLLLYVLEHTWTHATSATTKGEMVAAVVQPLLENDGSLFRSTVRMTGWTHDDDSHEDVAPSFLCLKRYLDLLGPDSESFSVARRVLVGNWDIPVAFIIAAVGAGDILRFMIDSGVDANEIDSWKLSRTLMHAAVLQEDYLSSDDSLWQKYCEMGVGVVTEETTAVQQLVDVGCRFDVIDWHKQSPLHCAAKKQDASMMQILLPHSKAIINWQDVNGKTAFFLSAERGMEDMVALLLQCTECDINLADQCGRTPLMAAANKGHASVVKQLLACPATRRDLSDNLGRTALFMAVQGGSQEIMDLLLSQPDGTKHDQVNNEGWNLLICAAYMGHDALIDPIIRIIEPDINAVDCRGRTALAWAAFRGNTAALKALLDQNGVDVNKKDFLGRTALTWAAFMRREEVVKVLLSCPNIDADCKDKYGQTWQDIAQHRGFVPSDIPMTPLTQTHLGEDVSFHVQSSHRSLNLIPNAEFSHDGRRLAMSGNFGYIEAWDIQSAQPISRLEHNGILICLISWSPDDSLITLYGYGSCTISLWSVEDAVLLQRVRIPVTYLTGSAWSPRGDYLIATMGHTNNTIWQQFLDGFIFPWPEFPHGIVCSAISPDGKWLIVGTIDKESYIFDISTRRFEKKVVHKSLPISIRVSQDSKYWISMLMSGNIDLCSVESGETIQEYIRDEEDMAGIACSFGGLNGCFVLNGGQDGFIHIWNRSTGSKVARIKAHTQSCHCVASNPVDPQMFVSGSNEGLWKIWKIEF